MNAKLFATIAATALFPIATAAAQDGYIYVENGYSGGWTSQATAAPGWGNQPTYGNSGSGCQCPNCQQAKFQQMQMNQPGAYAGNMNGGWYQQGQFDQSFQQGSFNSQGVTYERPSAAIAGGILQGIGNALMSSDPEKNKAAGGILQGIGNGMMMGSGQSNFQGQNSGQNSQGGYNYGGGYYVK